MHLQPRPELAIRRRGWDSLTLAWRDAVLVRNGVVSTQSMLAHDYAARAIRNTGNLLPALSSGAFFTLSGSVEGSVFPLVAAPGVVAARVGVTPSDFSETVGFVQDASVGKYYDLGITLGAAGLLGSQGATYHSGNLSAQRGLLGASDGTGSTEIALFLDYRRAAIDAPGGFRTPAPAVSPAAVEGSSTAGTAGRVYVTRNSSSSLKTYRGASLLATNTTAQSGSWNGSSTRRIFLGARNTNGMVNVAAAACITSAFITAIPLSDADEAALDAIIREFLVRMGRPTSD